MNERRLGRRAATWAAIGVGVLGVAGCADALGQNYSRSSFKLGAVCRLPGETIVTTLSQGDSQARINVSCTDGKTITAPLALQLSGSILSLKQLNGSNNASGEVTVEYTYATGSGISSITLGQTPKVASVTNKEVTIIGIQHLDAVSP